MASANHSDSQPQIAELASTALLLSSLSACTGGGGGTDAGEPPPPSPRADISEQQAARFLQQAALSSTEAEIAAVRGYGYDGWLERQLALPHSQSHWQWMASRGYQEDANNANNFNGADNTLWRKLILAPDTLRQRVVLALSEIFVVSMAGLPVAWRSFCIANYVDVLDQYAFGTYRQLLEAVTLSTGMGNYLNLRGNQKEDAKTGRVPDENYAREVLQLFSIGLHQLNLDGSVVTGGNGQPLESYTQDSITGLARVFTGWDYDNYNRAEPGFQGRPLSFNAARHSTLEKRFLGVSIAAGTPGTDAMRTALDTIANHPNVGPFFCRQLIQRLVCSNPSPAYIARVASVFNNNGKGVRGDLQAVIKVILLDDEARRDPASQPASWGKLREPVLRLVQWARTFGAASPNDVWNIGDTSDPSRRLGQSPLRSPSVFNFFLPGYVPPGTAFSSAGLVAPELQITNESSVIGYINWMQSVIQSGAGEVKANYADWLTQASDAPALVNKLALLLAAGQLSSNTLSSISNAVASINPSSDSARLNRIYAAILLVMACPEYIAFK